MSSGQKTDRFVVFSDKTEVSAYAQETVGMATFDVKSYATLLYLHRHKILSPDETLRSLLSMIYLNFPLTELPELIEKVHDIHEYYDEESRYVPRPKTDRLPQVLIPVEGVSTRPNFPLEDDEE